MDTDNVHREDAEQIRTDARTFLMEELVTPSLSYEEQADLASYMLRCIEGEGTFFSFLTEAIPVSETRTEEDLRRTAKVLREVVTVFFKDACAPRLKERLREESYVRETEERCYVYPAGYPYMDEFEYIDHCIAGDDDDDD